MCYKGNISFFHSRHCNMGRRRRRRARGCRDADELIPLARKYDSQSYTSMTDYQDEEQDQSDGSFTEEAGPSTGSDEKLRLIVLGGDDALMDKACGTILRKRNRKTGFQFGKLEPRNANSCGRQVSVLKTPFTWLEKLKSYFFFSRGVKAVRNEIESYESMMFPGPHAFLLVHRDVKDSGRENYLLRALSEVFGEEVLDYCMVLFIDQAKHNDPKKNYCLKMCGGRNHILHNTDDSVKKLFKIIAKMTESKNIFFTNHLECFRKASNYFQEEYVEKEDKLRRELNDTRDRENQLRDDIEKLQREMEEFKEQLENNRTDARVKEDYLRERERNLHRREKQLDEKKKELEIREREVRKRDKERSREHHQTTADPAVSEDIDRPLYEREGKLKSRDDSQSTGSLGIQKPVRRNSLDINPPYMT
ncbi:unnamed protein product [Leuciscus chuanchicus]